MSVYEVTSWVASTGRGSGHLDYQPRLVSMLTVQIAWSTYLSPSAHYINTLRTVVRSICREDRYSQLDCRVGALGPKAEN